MVQSEKTNDAIKKGRPVDVWLWQAPISLAIAIASLLTKPSRAYRGLSYWRQEDLELFAHWLFFYGGLTIAIVGGLISIANRLERSSGGAKQVGRIIKQSLAAGFGALGGCFLGLAASFIGGACVGLAAQLANPNDPSAGAVAIVGVFFVPFGFLGGLGLGGVAGWKWAARR